MQHWLGVSKKPANLGQNLSLTGFGSDQNFAQQISYGQINLVKQAVYGYRIDTMPGDSGAALVDPVSNLIFGIHTDPGCYNDPSSYNKGTRITGNHDLEVAIQSCLNATATGQSF